MAWSQAWVWWLKSCKRAPLVPVAEVTAVSLIDLMAGDKKATTGLTFVLLNDQGHLEVVAGVDRAVVRAELARFLEPA